MSTAVQLRRGTTVQHSTFTGAAGEVTVDTTKNTAVVHDGATAGGHPMAKEGNVPVDTHAAVSKATPVDADEVPLVDSAASNGLKKLTFANLKATLKTYFDTLYTAIGSAGSPTGLVSPYAGNTAPSGWLMCYGQAVSRATYAALYAAIAPSLGNFTITIASPGVVTLNSHGLQVGDRVRLSTSGALPTGLTANTDYYVTSTSFTTNTFTLSATLGGAAINTSGTQSGTHSAQYFPHGAGDGSTTFNVPDMRGRAPRGADAMGGTAASRITSGGSGIYGGALGSVGGIETTTLTAAQLASHSHTLPYNDGTAGGGASAGYTQGSVTGPSMATNTQGSGSAHQNTGPTLMLNYIIKT